MLPSTTFFQLLERNVKCYERRKSCYDRFGWCYAGDEWGFCNEINYLPDEPDSEDPLFEVPTFINPREVRLEIFSCDSQFSGYIVWHFIEKNVSLYILIDFRNVVMASCHQTHVFVLVIYLRLHQSTHSWWRRGQSIWLIVR